VPFEVLLLEEVCEHDTQLPRAGQAFSPVWEITFKQYNRLFYIELKNLWTYVHFNMNVLLLVDPLLDNDREINKTIVK
jgi:hypothetical protein